MRILTWNVNGLRSVLKKGFCESMEAVDPDVICLQETKVYEGVVPEMELKYPFKIFNHAEKKGYSGTAIFSKVEPLSWTFNCPAEPDPTEGRAITVEFEKIYLVNVYVPNVKPELVRLAFREKEWDIKLREYLLDLETRKPVILCGDLNVAHTEIDLANPESNHHSPGFTDEERAGFSALLDVGFHDIFREQHPGEGEHYTWWSYRSKARERNVGWRIDYFLLSQNLLSQVGNISIENQVFGSDHCPVTLDLVD